MTTYMAKLTTDEVKHLARLSKIAITSEEVDKFRNELESILQHVEQLQSIDTEGVEPTYQVNGLHNVTRSDDIKDYRVTPKELLKNAPDQKDNMIKVPKVL